MPVKSKVKISQNFVAFSEYMNFNSLLNSQTYFSSRLSYLDQSILLNSNMKKYLQYAKAYVISQNFEYDEAYFNSIDVEAQFIGL